MQASLLAPSDRILQIASSSKRIPGKPDMCQPNQPMSPLLGKTAQVPLRRNGTLSNVLCHQGSPNHLVK